MGHNSLRKKIMLKGVTTTPDDYLCEDGELAGAMGVESTDGGMEGVSQHGPKVVMNMAKDTEQVVFEHKVKPRFNWIIWDSQSHTIGYVKDQTPTSAAAQTVTGISAALRSDNLPMVEAIGNTLIVRCSNGGANTLHYVLWKTEGQGSYKYLGTHIPELSLEFGLGIDYVRDWGTYTDSQSTFPAPYLIENLPEEMAVPNFNIDTKNKPIITSAVMASVNKKQFEARKEGYFTQPFLVRYALKMYDGTTTMASAPVYMPVTEKKNGVSYPLCVVDMIDTDEMRFHTEHVRSKLKYRVLDTDLSAIKEWSDIITGVEIYASAPIYTYNPSGEIENVFGTVTDATTPDEWAGTKMESGNDEIKAYGTLDGEHLLPLSGYEPEYVEEVKETRKKYIGWNRDYLATQAFGQIIPGDGEISIISDSNDAFSDQTYWATAAEVYEDESMHWACLPRTPRKLMLLPEKTQAEFEQEVKDCSRFYKVAKYDLNDLKTKDQFVKDGEEILEDVDIQEGILNNIEVGQQLEDEFRSHDTISGNIIKTYNARLNIADVTRTLWNGFNPACFFMHYDDREPGTTEKQIEMTVRVKDSMQTIVLKGTGTMKYGYWNTVRNPFIYLYFPNTDVDKIWLKLGTEYGEFNMDQHSGLNGVVFYNGSLNVPMDWRVKEYPPAATTNYTVTEANKLYTSDAENPWKFKPTNINTVGSDRILNVGAVTTALSQGQHGSFPMYCMTTEGIWSLSVNSTGGWSTSQTVTRDVMRERTPLLLIDDAIVFMSSQGLMLLQGDKTVLMTGSQKGKPTVKISKLPGLKTLIMSGKLADWSKLIKADATDKEIDEALTGDLMQYLNGDTIDLYYDYVNQRVIVGCYGEDTKPYCWIYYLNKRQWTMAPWKLMNHVNTYPECYAMLEDHEGKNYMVKLDTTERDWNDDEAGDDGMEDDVLLLTRPIKLGEAADMLKELENMTVEGLFDKKKLGMAVWGTRNYKDWHLVGSCKGLHLVRKHGSGYLAFVVAITGKLGADEYLDSLTMEYQPRFVKKLHGMGYAGTE